MKTRESDLVSVIIPVYNAEKYLAETLDSALGQTYKDIEIVIVDDCSTDSSTEIINRYMSNNNNIKYIRNETNQGAAVSRNTGIRYSRGQYIAFLDSDDVWDKTKIEKQISHLREKKACFGFTAYDMIDAYGQQIKDKIKIKEHIVYKDQLTKTVISTPTVILDATIIGNIEIPLRRTGQDYALWLKLLREYDAFGIDEALVHVRRRPSSLSKNKFQNIRDVWEIQTRNERIPKIKASLNVFKYCIYALKKRFL
ncbi:MAG: glycosyltransferase [Clostridiaceae bacterium]|jgi:teichuronic acid biosynthesis glycosyltransferase TuaG|nr:glycosyltransferase [Clostridiaceae bacterium]